LYGIYAASVSVYALLNSSGTLQSNWYEQDAFIHTYVVSVAVGWFVWDVLDCSLHPEWGPMFFVHGVVALGIFSSCMVRKLLNAPPSSHSSHAACALQKPFLLHTAAIVLMYEASTPIMHLRKTLLTMGYAKSHPNMFIGVSVRVTKCAASAAKRFTPARFQVVFFLVFFITRIAVGLWASVIWWRDATALVSTGVPHSYLVLGFDMMANLVMNGMNLLWFYQMLQVLVRGLNVKSIAEADKKQM